MFHFGLLLFSALAATQPAATQPAPKFPSHAHAIALFMQQYPNQDWSTTDNLKKISRIETEFDAISEKYLTDQGKRVFIQTPRYALGQVIISFKDDMKAKVEKLLDAKHLMDLQKSKDSLPEFKDVITKFGLQTLKEEDPYIALIYFSQDTNPETVSAALKAIPGVEYAEPNGIMHLIELPKVEFRLSRLGELPAVYRFNITWQSDPDRFTYETERTYIEAPDFDQNSKPVGTASIVGKSGKQAPNQYTSVVYKAPQKKN